MTHIEDRRNALRSFIAKQGGFAAVATKFKLSQSQASYLSQLTAKDSTASFGEKSAKNWEDRLGLPADALVRPSTENGNAIANASLAPTPPSTGPGLVETLAQLEAELSKLSPLLINAGRDALVKWASGEATAAETSATLNAFAQASESLPSASVNLSVETSAFVSVKKKDKA